jgi:hypothetical protein
MIKSIEERRLLIRFLRSTDVTTGEIYGIITIEYGDNCVAGRKSVSGWKYAR